MINLDPAAMQGGVAAHEATLRRADPSHSDPGKVLRLRSAGILGSRTEAAAASSRAAGARIAWQAGEMGLPAPKPLAGFGSGRFVGGHALF